MLSAFCTLLTALGYYFSINLGEQWWLVWFAPVPVLWLAFSRAPRAQVFIAAWAAYALGSASLLRAYGATLPPFVMAEALLGPSLLFALAVMAGGRLYRTTGPFSGMLAFALIFCGGDFVIAFNQAGGSGQSPALALVGAPALIQLAAAFGFPVLTFLIGFVPAGIAATLNSGKRAPALVAFVVFAANAGFGYWRMSAPPESVLKVALVNSNDAVGKLRIADRAAALDAIDAYVKVLQAVPVSPVDLIVLPENIALIAPEWRAEAEAHLAAAAKASQATLIAGFNTTIDAASRNVSWAFSPDDSRPVTYQKRHLVPALETRWYTPGPGPKVMPNGVGLEICKDMDFTAMLRVDELATHPTVLAVPAWDFDVDDWSHARVAVLRSVENGVPMARTARDGLLTLNDRYGRLIQSVRSVSGFSVVTGELPIDGRGGDTLYDRIGDVFGWGSVVLGVGLLLFSYSRRHDESSQASRDASNSVAPPYQASSRCRATT